MNVPRIREELFDKLTADLEGIRPELRGLILCPFCMNSFERVALTMETGNRLTLEHIVQGAVGGKAYTLTCKECNNILGSELEGHLVKMLRARTWFDGDGSTLRGKMRVGSTELPMRISWTVGEKSPSTIQVPGGPPAVLEAFPAEMERFRRNECEMNLEFSFEYAESNVQRAFLRIAYLELFDHLGYSYALSEAGEHVRRLIEGANGEQISRLLPVMRELPVTIQPIGSDGLIEAYLILVRMETERRWHQWVLLPAPSLTGDSLMRTLSHLGACLRERPHTSV